MTADRTERPLENIVNRLGELATRSHYTCEDRWYSCQLSEEGSANEFKPEGFCDCGADKHNAEVASLLDEFKKLTAN